MGSDESAAGRCNPRPAAVLIHDLSGQEANWGGAELSVIIYVGYLPLKCHVVELNLPDR
jgi:hypothetical protein